MSTNFDATALTLSNEELFKSFWAIDRRIYQNDGPASVADLIALTRAHVILREIALSRPALRAGDVLEKMKVLHTEIEREHDGVYLDTLKAIEADLKTLSTT